MGSHICLVEWGLGLVSAAIVPRSSLRIWVDIIPCGQNNVSYFSKKGLVDPAASNFLTLKPSGPEPFRQAPGGPGIEDGCLPAWIHVLPNRHCESAGAKNQGRGGKSPPSVRSVFSITCGSFSWWERAAGRAYVLRAGDVHQRVSETGSVSRRGGRANESIAGLELKRQSLICLPHHRASKS